MKQHFTLRLCSGVLAALLLATPGFAQTAHAPPAALMSIATPSAQEKQDEALLDKAFQAVAKERFVGLAKYIPALSQALDRAADITISKPETYHLMAMMLGAYYVEMHQYEPAITALDKALVYAPNDPTTIGEKGVALQALRRFDEALAAYDAGIASGLGGPNDKARLYRGRGVVLIDLKRIDEAEAALKTSLELQPGHPLALNELKYIAEIRETGRQDRGLQAPVTVENALKAPVN